MSNAGNIQFRSQQFGHIMRCMKISCNCGQFFASLAAVMVIITMC